MNTSFLSSLGWNDSFQESFHQDAEPGALPARIIGQERGHYRIQFGPQETLEAVITKKFRHSAREAVDFPAVGDWITFTHEPNSQHATIHRTLKRKNALQRKKVGTQSGTQVIATNVDFAFIVTSLNEDFDLERVGRYVTICRECDVSCILLLTKADLCLAPQSYIEKCRDRFNSIESVLISKESPDSFQQLKRFFEKQKTTVLLGSSGVGKSTLTNYLVGADSQKTQTLSAESRGRHTTTSRNLLVTRWGGLVIDTPGMQDIAPLNQHQGIQEDFSDIEELALKCKFTNCQHRTEPGCAINAALKTGALDSIRWTEFKASVSSHEKRSPRVR
ncbi:MAG: ribosome small subunit-dependent GTPase A [Bdellovibrionales bacterium]|nr:ribosome small subunit-dependent GTPase A [Bdellovibrionales bacterium]